MKRTALQPDSEPLALAIIASVAFHVGLVAFIACMGFIVDWFDWRSHKPLLDTQAMEVSMMVMKKSPGRMPTKAETVKATAPVAPTETPHSAGAPTETPSAAARTSDLSLHKPDAKPTKGDPDRAAAIDRALRDALMEEALADASEGDKNVEATSPDSTSDESYNVHGNGRADPELAKYRKQIETLFKQNFHPLKSVVAANPKLRTVIIVRIDPTTGRVLGYDIHRASGNESYDAKAVFAVESVPVVPLPPAKHAHVVEDGLEITFDPQ